MVNHFSAELKKIQLFYQSLSKNLFDQKPHKYIKKILTYQKTQFFLSQNDQKCKNCTKNANMGQHVYFTKKNIKVDIHLTQAIQLLHDSWEQLRAMYV